MNTYIQKVSDLLGGGPPVIENGLKNLAKSDLLKIGNHLTGVLSDKKLNLDPPQLVVVGTQSSGKSSVLNRIIEMDILPTGKMMVTRTPMNLQLITSDRNLAEFGDYVDGCWRANKKIEMVSGTNYIEQIRAEIENQTFQKAGQGQGISYNPIILKLYCPHLPSLSLIDLPGLVSVAQVDKGQPADIKNQLRQMVGSYIKSDRTIILLVIPARNDIEVDMGIELVKEYDPKGLRTIGLMTKVDLMNSGTDIGDYLSNREISQSLQLKYGYYAIKNKGPDQTDVALSAKQICDSEMNYFRSHSVYSQMLSSNRLGINALTQSLTEILSDHIRQSLPSFMNEINYLEQGVNKSLVDLGSQMPEKEVDLVSMAQMLVANFCRTFNGALEERGSKLNYGRQLKDIFVQYRKVVSGLKYNFSDKLIAEALTNCDGNHMISVPSIEILEYCLKNGPLHIFDEPSIQTLEHVNGLLLKLVDDVSQEIHIDRFANLTNAIKKELVGHILTPHYNLCAIHVKDLIKIEENYIWTDDPQFLGELQKLYQTIKPNQLEYGLIRQLINGYFDCVKKNLSDRVPKEIMYYYIRGVENSLCDTLFDRITKSLNVVKLLEESPAIAEKRKKLITQKNQLSSIKNMIVAQQNTF